METTNFIIGSDPSSYQVAFDDDSSEARGYTKGLLFVACFIMSFYTFWGLIILLLKFLGPLRVGAFSGYPYQDENMVSRTGRSIFFISAVMVLVFSSLSITKGLTQLQHTSDIVDATNQDLIKIHDEFVGLADKMQLMGRDALPIRDRLAEILGGDICPLVARNGNQILRNTGNSTFISLNSLSNFIEDYLQDVDKASGQLAFANRKVDEAVQRAEFTTGAIVGIMIPFFIVPSLLIVCLLMGWTESYFEPFYMFTEYFTIPFFGVMVIFAYLACGFVAMGTEGNADFCSGGEVNTPEATIMNIMARQGLSEGEFYHDAIHFYSHQCDVEGPWGFLEEYHSKLTTATFLLDTLSEMILGDSLDMLSQECGLDYSAIWELITKLRAHTSILQDASERSLTLWSCERIVPMYTNAVYDSVCRNNMDAGVWLFACSFLISFFGMVMIMLRGACYPLLVWEDEALGKELYSTESSNEKSHDDEVALEEVISGDQDSDFLEDEGTELFLEEDGSDGHIKVGNDRSYDE